jgi:hypothetical protein
LHSHRKKNQDFSVLNLKSHYRGYRYACETIKKLPHIILMFLREKPDGILLADIFSKLPVWALFTLFLAPPIRVRFNFSEDLGADKVLCRI